MQQKGSMPLTEEQKKLRRRLRDRERRFQCASPEKKRVHIAQDVLAQLDTGTLKTSWMFANIPKLKDEEPGRDLREVILSRPRCSACAVGALFLGAVRQHNQITVGQVRGSVFREDALYTAILTYLEKFFSPQQIRLIEFTFEEGRGHFRELVSESGLWDIDLERRARSFARRRRGRLKRLRAIMENIIENRGTFVP